MIAGSVKDLAAIAPAGADSTAVDAVPVEENVARVAELEVTAAGTGCGGNLDGAGCSTCRHLEGDGFGGNHGVAADGNTGDIDSGNIDKVLSLEGHILTVGSPFIADGSNLRDRRKDLEIVGDGVLGRSDKVNLVGLHGGRGARHCNDQGVVGNVAGIQHGGLVVEIDVVHAAQVGAYDAEHLVHEGLGDEHVLVGIPYEIYRRLAFRCVEAVRIILCAGCESKDSGDDSYIFKH